MSEKLVHELALTVSGVIHLSDDEWKLLLFEISQGFDKDDTICLNPNYVLADKN